jgi:DNA-binding transcriptional ArsR family regulator
MQASDYDGFLAIADPNRRAILTMLSKEKLSINSIANKFDISRPAISKHIKILYETGFVDIEENGRERLCVLNQSGFNDIQDWINYFEKYWTRQLRDLDTFLSKEKPKRPKK